VADVFLDTNAASLGFPQDDIALTNFPTMATSFDQDFIHCLAALTNFPYMDPPTLHDVEITDLEDNLFVNSCLLLSPSLVPAFQETKDVLTLLTNTIAGFSNDHEDLCSPISAFHNVSHDLVLPATEFYHLDDSPASNDKSADVSLAATDLVFGDHFSDDAFTITEDDDDDDDDSASDASDATNNVDVSDDMPLANSEKVSYEYGRPSYTASLDGILFDDTYHSSDAKF
jgi:hypothetical protein